MPVARYLTPQVRRDLRRKMVFVGGPRQVGKTTLALALLKGDQGYLSWDIRDVDGREVDFVVTERRRPLQLIECKWADSDVARGLIYLKERFPDAEALQIHATGKKDYETERGIRILPAVSFLRTLV